LSLPKQNNVRKILGRVEKVGIPEWGLYDIKAKIDTGAYTSSLHCHHIVPLDDNRVRFNLLDPSHKNYNEKLFEVPAFNIKKVKSSNGFTEERIIIKTTIVIAGQSLLTQLSLTDRSRMRYPLLIGRKLLKNRFLVDVSKTY